LASVDAFRSSESGEDISQELAVTFKIKVLKAAPQALRASRHLSLCGDCRWSGIV
jgi:hypothetical protein